MTGPGQLQRGSSAREIARAFRTSIEAGEYRHQQQLPSTRVLAEEWKTSVATITRAMAQLADEGLVINRDRAERLVNFPGPDQRTSIDERASELSIIEVGGYAGSGKSELAKIIGRLTGSAVVDKDTITRPVVEVALKALGLSRHDRQSQQYLEMVRPAEYAALHETVLENLRCGISTVATAPYIREFADAAWCARTGADYASLGATRHTIWLRCDLDSMYAYLTRRDAGRDADKLANWETYSAGLDLDFAPAMQHVILDNSISNPPLQDQVRTVLDQWGVPTRR